MDSDDSSSGGEGEYYRDWVAHRPQARPSPAAPGEPVAGTSTGATAGTSSSEARVSIRRMGVY